MNVHTHIRWNIILPLNQGDPLICHNMNGPKGHYAEKNQAQIEKSCVLSHAGSRGKNNG